MKVLNMSKSPCLQMKSTGKSSTSEFKLSLKSMVRIKFEKSSLVPIFWQIFTSSNHWGLHPKFVICSCLNAKSLELVAGDIIIASELLNFTNCSLQFKFTRSKSILKWKCFHKSVQYFNFQLFSIFFQLLFWICVSSRPFLFKEYTLYYNFYSTFRRPISYLKLSLVFFKILCLNPLIIECF